MSRASGTFILLALAAVVLVPLATAHAFFFHVVFVESHHVAQPSIDPGLGVLTLVSLLASFPVMGALVSLVRLSRASRRLRQVTGNARERERGGIAYRRIEGNEVALFTAGFWRPRIYATVGAEEAMPAAVFRAALLHEQAHVEAADTRWRHALVAIESAFGLLPPVRRSLQALVLRGEMTADERAIVNGAAPRDLFEAVVLAASVSGPVSPLAGVGSTPRLCRLANPGEAVQAVPWPGALSIVAWAVGIPVAGHALVLAGFLCWTVVS